MRDSVFSVTVVARAVTVFVCVVVVRDTGVLVVARGVKMVIGVVFRGATVVFTALREVVVRAVRAVVVVGALSRDGAFFVRNAAPALNMQTTEIRTKDRIFFISESMLANLQNSGQVKSQKFTQKTNIFFVFSCCKTL